MTLARSIVGQQISLKAADSVWQKLLCAVPAISSVHIAAANSAELRRCGLS
jgi:DNA-3-methyladenine glycosylase II